MGAHLFLDLFKVNAGHLGLVGRRARRNVSFLGYAWAEGNYIVISTFLQATLHRYLTKAGVCGKLIDMSSVLWSLELAGGRPLGSFFRKLKHGIFLDTWPLKSGSSTRRACGNTCLYF
jgi:hypothetical protein